jgi:dihydroneopterin aldolase
MENVSKPPCAPKTSNTDLVFAEIKGLTVDGEIGVLPSEIGRTQRITFDACVGVEPRMIEIPDTADGLLKHGFALGRVRNIIREEAGRGANLLETLASVIADQILGLPGARTVRVSVSKSRTWADTESISISVSKSR